MTQKGVGRGDVFGLSAVKNLGKQCFFEKKYRKTMEISFMARKKMLYEVTSQKYSKMCK